VGEENTYKPEARCRFYAQCATYNAGLLKEEVELWLCGKGQPVESAYIPRILHVYTPTSKEAGLPSEMAVCPAFSGKIESLLTGKIQEYMEQVYLYWIKGKNLDDIFKL
jgi:hypothetical protein